MFYYYLKEELVFILLAGILQFGQAQNLNSSTASNAGLEKTLLDQGYEKIELSKMKSGHLKFSALINGVHADLILDTGAGGTFIETKRKDYLKLSTVNSETTATGAGGTGLQMQVSEGNTLKMGNLILNNSKVMLMSLDHVNIAFEKMGLEKVDGVIGADLLTSTQAIIDYNQLALYLKN